MNFRKCILESFEEILEQMVFLYFEETDVHAMLPGNLPYVTEISFDGVFSGSLKLSFSSETGDEIARNLLGIRPQDELVDGVMEDAICEFTNMVMGRTMALLDPARDFNLGIPKLSGGCANPPAQGENMKIFGTLDDQPCLIEVDYQAP